MSIAFSGGVGGADEIEAQLAAEGLAPIEGPEVMSLDDTAPLATDIWQAWAKKILREGVLLGDVQRSVWSLYAEGESLSNIAIKLRMSRHHVWRAVSRVKKHNAPSPIENPWKKSGRADKGETVEKKSVLVHYELIRFKQGERVNLPGVSVGKDFVRDVDGRPHAGGIEIVWRGNKGDQDAQLVTVPWWRIASAERSAEDAA